MTVGSSHKQGVLKERFGFSEFRPYQESVVDAILARRDAFIVMPTGGGKSLCYQVPALLMEGTCIVVSPLISLMKDQVDTARANGIAASYLNSTLDDQQKREVEQDLLQGALNLLYISPERFGLVSFKILLRKIQISFFAIDEAHCVSEWGHDFRPDYLQLSSIVQDFSESPVAAFTATATPRVQQDIITRLGLRDPHCVRASFNRPNLFYRVLPKKKPSEQILRFVQAHSGQSGIIYRTTRKSVEKTAEYLSQHGVRAVPYHAGLEEHVRSRNQDAFNRDEVEVVVATIAFGMGIDKSNVRYILHADLPKNMEGYYQETGRAGRDGDPAECLLLFGPGDIPTIRHFFSQVEDTEERAHLEKNLQRMIQYGSVHACRRRQLLAYFGETLEEDPSASCCDICSGEVKAEDATREAQMALSAIKRSGERFGAQHIIDIVMGNQTEQIVKFGHHQLPTFGVGKDGHRQHFRHVIDTLIARGFVLQDPGRFPTLSLSDTASDILFNHHPLHILQTEKKTTGAKTRTSKPASISQHPELFEALRALRKSLADEQGVPPFVIFSDKTLHELADQQPQTPEALLTITGIGETKQTRYGKPFLALLQTHRGQS